LELIKWLIETQKADPNEKDDYGWGCLHWAAYRLNDEMFKWLLDHASVDIDGKSSS